MILVKCCPPGMFIRDTLSKHFIGGWLYWKPLLVHTEISDSCLPPCHAIQLVLQALDLWGRVVALHCVYSTEDDLFFRVLRGFKVNIRHRRSDEWDWEGSCEAAAMVVMFQRTIQDSQPGDNSSTLSLIHLSMKGATTLWRVPASPAVYLHYWGKRWWETHRNPVCHWRF